MLSPTEISELASLPVDELRERMEQSSAETVNTALGVSVTQPNLLNDISVQASVDLNLAISAFPGSVGSLSEDLPLSLGNANDLVSKVDPVAFGNSGLLDIEDMLSAEFAYSTTVMGVAITNEIAINGGAISGDFRANLINNSFVKAGTFVNTVSGVGFQASVHTGLVDIDVSVGLDDFDFNLDDVTVKIDILNPSFDSVVSLVTGVSALIDVEALNVVAEILEYVQFAQAAIVVSGAIINGLLGYAVVTPEPITKVIASAIALIVAIFTWISNDDLEDRIDAAVSEASSLNNITFQTQINHLVRQYHEQFRLILENSSYGEVNSVPSLFIELVGTQLNVGLALEFDQIFLNDAAAYFFSVLQNPLTLRSYGEAFMAQQSVVEQIRARVATVKFTGGYYVKR